MVFMIDVLVLSEISGHSVTDESRNLSLHSNWANRKDGCYPISEVPEGGISLKFLLQEADRCNELRRNPAETHSVRLV